MQQGQGQIDLRGVYSGLSAFMSKGKTQVDAPATPMDTWPPDYDAVIAWRAQKLGELEANPDLVASARTFYSTRPISFINHWVWTFDPRNAARNEATKLPLVLFPRQREFIHFVNQCMRSEVNGLCEKARTMGATWTLCGYSVWLWLFHPGVSIGWGSRKAHLVDRIGDPDSIFEKLRMIVRDIPKPLMPLNFNEDDHLLHMRIINPENGSTITGEAGDNIGRGGRKLLYVKDESAHYERPEKIEAALFDNTRCQIDVSSVGPLGNVFNRKRETGIEWARGMKMEQGKTYVFVFDYFDHPGNNRKTYARRKEQASNQGLAHVFAREIDRDYAASLDGVVIPQEWVQAAVDAHIKLGIEPSGPWVAGLDVADGGLDRNALIRRQGIIARFADEWVAPDGGVTARRALQACTGLGKVSLQYDCIGVGATIKAEVNRLISTGQLPSSVTVTAWNAGAAVLDPSDKVNDDDRDYKEKSPTNKDFFHNLKAQAWWAARRKFETTWRALNEADFTYHPDDLVSLDSTMPLLRSLMKELSQARFVQSHNMKMMVDKTPEGMKSPNLADGFVMCYWPWRGPVRTVSLFGPKILTAD